MDVLSAPDNSARNVDKKKIQSSFGRQIREIRESLAISQEALASRANLDRSYIGSIERGERNITLQKICQLAVALNVDPSELLRSVDREAKRK